MPDISSSQILMNNVPKPEDSKFKRTTYFNHEMTQVRSDGNSKGATAFRGLLLDVVGVESCCFCWY